MRRLFAGTVLSAVLMVALVAGSVGAQEGYGADEDSGTQGAESSAAQQTESTTLDLTPSRDSGVSGTATLTDVEGGVEVSVDLQGMPEAGVEHIGHIHEGATCADDRAGNGAGAEYPLQSVTVGEDGTGSAVSMVEGVTVQELASADAERYVNYHAEMTGEETPPGISCADIVAQGEDLPATGGLPLGGVAAGLGAALVAGGLLVRRRLS